MDTFNKKEREKKKEAKKKEKLLKKENRKEKGSTGSWESMMAYVDENGNICDTPPDPAAKVEIKAKNIEIGIPCEVFSLYVGRGYTQFNTSVLYFTDILPL